MKLVAGLGNPGAQYEKTRHNIGFAVVGSFAEKYEIKAKFESKFNALVGKGSVFGKDTIVVEPLTFMNLSGEAIIKIVNWYKIDISEIIVVYDDIDINLGKLRFRRGGSDGGHNGIKSIIECFGGRSDFSRLRVGIGPGPNGDERRNFVLRPFFTEQQKLVSDSIKLAVKGLEVFIKKDINAAMNKYNGVDLTSPPKIAKKKGQIISDFTLSKLEKPGILLDVDTECCIKNKVYPIDLLSLKKE